MEPGWYILEYHRVDWEEPPLLRVLRGTIPPDVFEAHIKQLKQYGELVDIRTGLEQALSGKIKRPLFSLWFDDGYSSLRYYVVPILKSYGITAAVSLCSRFWRRNEVFWRFKVAALFYSGRLAAVENELRNFGWHPNSEFREFSISAFSSRFLQHLDEWTANLNGDFSPSQAMEWLETVEGIRELQREGWELCNHTSAHYPVSEPQGMDLFQEQFEECEQALQEDFQVNSLFWVLPFDRPRYRAANLLNQFYRTDDQGRYLVLVGDGWNQQENLKRRVIFRINVSAWTGRDIVKAIQRVARPGKHLIRHL